MTVEKLKLYVVVAIIIAAAMAGSFYAGRWQRENKGKPLPTADADIPKHDVTTKEPVKALDKKELANRDVIPHSALDTPHSEILATGKIEDDSGLLYVGAELNTDTGETRLIQNRPTAEFMRRNAFGLAIEANPHGIVKEAYCTRTVARLWDAYAFGTLGGRQREDNTNELFVRVNAEWRF